MMKASDIRNRMSSKHREKCFVCGGFPEITQLHHVVPLHECANLFNQGYKDDIDVPMVWLCPNCHAYIHQILKGSCASIFLRFSEREMAKIKEIMSMYNATYNKIFKSIMKKNVC